MAVTAEGRVRFVPAPMDILDATGAGDSFWSGFIAAHMGGRQPEECLRVGSGVAAIKLGQQGPLRERVAWEAL